jgi:hypothetical protein
LTGFTIVGLVAILGVAAPSLRGDDWNLKTSFTVDQQIEVPGAILEPDTTYIIHVMELQANRNVMRISNEDESEVITTFHTVDDRRREELVENPTFDFMEVPAGHPKPVRAWYYPGRVTGFEFLYPEEQKERIAAYGSRAPAAEQVAALNTPAEPVFAEPAPPAVQPEIAAEAEPAPVEPLAIEKQEEIAVERAKPEEAEPVLTAQAQPPAQSQPSAQAPAAPQADALPATAGALPLLGLLGALSVGAGMLLRRF